MGAERYVKHLRRKRPTIVQIFDEYVPAGGNHGSPRPIDLDRVIVPNAGYWSDSTIDLISSRLELSRILKNPTGKERRLAKALARISDRYDLVLIDCAPTESILTDAAYFASRYVIVPVRPEFMATIGLPLLARSMQEFQIENDDHEIDIAGLVFNHGDYSSGPETRQSIAEVRKQAGEHGWHIFENELRHSRSYPQSGTCRSTCIGDERCSMAGSQRIRNAPGGDLPHDLASEEDQVGQDRIFLDLNLRLLIAQHGKARVSHALSAIEDDNLCRDSLGDRNLWKKGQEEQGTAASWKEHRGDDPGCEAGRPGGRGLHSETRSCVRPQGILARTSGCQAFPGIPVQLTCQIPISNGCTPHGRRGAGPMRARRTG